jgi:ATP-dependent 26S proteasome regulatory subunit
LLLDELDAIAKKRDDLGEVGELKRLVTVLIQEIDDWPESGILIAATNHADLLDRAIWRRFDLVIEFTTPTKEQINQAITEFLGHEHTLAVEEIAILTLLLDGASFSEVQREIMQIRRQALVLNKKVEEVLQTFIQNRKQNLTLKKRKEIALCLLASGYSQHQANNLTGVSRDTIRSAIRKVK